VRLLTRLAWRNIWRQRRRTLITAGAMAIGVAFCMAMMALVDGVYADLFDLAVGENLGHAQIHHPDYPSKRAIWETVPDAEVLLGELDGEASVVSATPRVYGHGLMAFTDEALGAQLIGVDPAREQALTRVGDRIATGRYLADQPAHEVVLGVGLAERLEVAPGGEVVVVTQAADGSMGNDLYTVVGLFESGSVMQDRAGAWLHLADAQELLVLPDQVHEVALQTEGKPEVDAMVAAVGPLTRQHGLLLRSWREINPQLAQMMDMADASSGIFLFIVFGIAALGVLNTMLMSVFERTRELGVIGALGLRPRQMVALVILETFALAAVATAAGVPLGLGLDAYLVFHGLDLTAVMDSYSVIGVNYDPVMMGEFHADKVLQTVFGLFFISLLAAIWPAIRAARLKPVEAMRQE
jgi:putative ABC transport system permease protein